MSPSRPGPVVERHARDRFDPAEVEPRWIAAWAEAGVGHADPESDRPPYSIVIPPPNVTGALHLGHALNNTIQDMLIRMAADAGLRGLWMCGTDHAGIATQAVVEKRARRRGGQPATTSAARSSSPHLGVEGRVRRRRSSASSRLMGCSCDWERDRFTLDDAYATGRPATFFRLFTRRATSTAARAGQLGHRPPHGRRRRRDRVREVTGTLWTIAYPVADGSRRGRASPRRGPRRCSATPAVAVHPDDERYKHLIGRTVELPLTGREIPIIADGILVDPSSAPARQGHARARPERLRRRGRATGCR